MKKEDISEKAWQIAIVLSPFIDNSIGGTARDEVVESFAKTIQGLINDVSNNDLEFSEKELITAIKFSRKLPTEYLSTDIVELIRVSK